MTCAAYVHHYVYTPAPWKEEKREKIVGGKLECKLLTIYPKRNLENVNRTTHGLTPSPKLWISFYFSFKSSPCMPSCNDVVAAKLFVREGDADAYLSLPLLRRHFYFLLRYSFQQSKKFLWLDGATRKARLIQRRKLLGAFIADQERGGRERSTRITASSI